jgi:hypothetical protein
MSDVTRLLDAAAAGDPQDAARLLPLVYDELRKLAAVKLAHEKPGQTLDALRLLSIGTGLNPAYLAGDRLDWGKVQWARPIVDAMIDGTMGVADYQCTRLLSERYHRLQPVLAEVIPLDAADQIERLVAIAQEVDLGATIDWLQKSF